MFAERVKKTWRRPIVIGLFSLFLIPYSFANDSIYQGTVIKLDLASPVFALGTSRGRLQHYELAANVRLAQRFYPTLEMGYAGGAVTRGDSLSYNGHGGFMRLGCDINPLKRHPESPHALLVGVRIGTAVQGFNNGVGLQSGVAADCWGEIVLGCQVNIINGFYMGWMGRFRFLFTRELEGLPAADMRAIYIPGYGARDKIGWGVNYYLGWKF